jgi:mRNA interferase RelE/StbE
VAYTVQFTPSAKRELSKLSLQVRARIVGALDALKENPHMPGVTKLSGQWNTHRFRVGDYRILYTIENDEMLILVVKVGHRRDVYRRL